MNISTDKHHIVDDSNTQLSYLYLMDCSVHQARLCVYKMNKNKY